MSTLIVEVNGESVELAKGVTLSQLLRQLEITTRHVAVELNLEIIPFEKHEERILVEGDQLEVVSLVGGG